MRPIYLTGERVYLRAMVEEDKAHAIAWHAGAFPVNSAFGEERLQELHAHVWDTNEFQLAVVRLDDEQVVGGALVTFSQRDRKAGFAIHMAPLLEQADALRAEALTLLVPWLLEDHNLRRVDAHLDADQPASIAAAQALGMFESVRLREFWRRPGGRVDAVMYQILNPNEEYKYA